MPVFFAGSFSHKKGFFRILSGPAKIKEVDIQANKSLDLAMRARAFGQ